MGHGHRRDHEIRPPPVRGRIVDEAEELGVRSGQIEQGTVSDELEHHVRALADHLGQDVLDHVDRGLAIGVRAVVTHEQNDGRVARRRVVMRMTRLRVESLRDHPDLLTGDPALVIPPVVLGDRDDELRLSAGAFLRPVDVGHEDGPTQLVSGEIAVRTILHVVRAVDQRSLVTASEAAAIDGRESVVRQDVVEALSLQKSAGRAVQSGAEDEVSQSGEVDSNPLVEAHPVLTVPKPPLDLRIDLVPRPS